MKTIFKSKTAALGFITSLSGAASYFFPEVGEFITSNSPTILIVLGAISVALRLATKDKVILFPIGE